MLYETLPNLTQFLHFGPDEFNRRVTVPRLLANPAFTTASMLSNS